MSMILTGRFWIECIVAGISTVAFSVLFYVPRKYYPLNGVCGAVVGIVVGSVLGVGGTGAQPARSVTQRSHMNSFFIETSNLSK